MTGASWGVSFAGVVTAALCIIGLRHHRHLPGVTHPISQRAAIAFCYVAGCAIAATALGTWAHDALAWPLGMLGHPGSPDVHAVVTITAMVLVAAVIVALVFVPEPAAAYLALATPFVLQLAGGHLHALLDVVPAQQVVETISKWIGG